MSSNDRPAKTAGAMAAYFEAEAFLTKNRLAFLTSHSLSFIIDLCA